MSADRQRRDVRQVEELDDQLAEILAFSRDRAELYRRTPGRITTRNADYPEVADILTKRVREQLEDEIIPAVETDSSGRIQTYEVNREIIKKALIGLKVTGLKRIARESGLTTTMGIEKLAESVAHAYGWDEDKIARLVLENEEEIRPDRGYVSRFFPLSAPPAIAATHERLGYVAGRYIRTGVARWFVFSEINSDGEGELELLGSLRSYSAGIDDRVPDTPRLLATVANDAPARLLIDDSSILTVRDATLGVARAAVQATDVTAGIDPLYRIPFIDTAAPTLSGELHDASKFMLDLLVNRLPAEGLGDINLTVARFKLAEDSTEPWDSEAPERRATLRAVRFEGDYLLGSVPACQLLAIEQRPLSDMTFQVVSRNRERIIVGRYPVRISIERDHLAVETSYGAGNKELSAEVHAAVTRCVVDEINDGFGNEDRLEEFTQKILIRAEADEAVDTMDLLGEDLV